MKRMPYKSEPGFIATLIALGMTVLGAVAAYAYKVLSGDTFSWRTLCLQLIHLCWLPDYATCHLLELATGSNRRHLRYGWLV